MKICREPNRSQTGLDDEVIEEVLTGVLPSFELHDLLERRRRLVEHIESLIAERGADLVLF